MYKGINVTFTNVQTLTGNEGLVVRCDIKYNGKKIAKYFDDGNGGKPDVSPIGNIDKDANGEYKPSAELVRNRKLLVQLEAEFKILPKIPSGIEGVDWELDDCLDFAVDKFLNERESLKLAKKGLLIKKDGEQYSLTWKGGSLEVHLKKNKENFLKVLSDTIVKYQSLGYTIDMQDYYISLGVEPKIFQNPV